MVFSRAISLMSVRTSCFCMRVEAVGGLVEDQHLGVVHDGLREADAALEALGQRFDGLREHRLELQPADDVVEPRLALRALRGRAGRR